MFKFCVKKSVHFIFYFIFISVNVFSQTANDPSSFAPNIIPPSPIAYELGKYGNVPVGMFTGSPNINIPIYTYKSANIEVPITMFYTSNGVKVDEISSNVGQSWNMSYSGIITRVVRDKPDEELQNSPIPMAMTETISSRSPQALDYFKYIGENDVDSEADLYSFNFGNYSGKFILDGNNNVMLMPVQPISIGITAGVGGLFNFNITTPDGIVYYFEESETSFQTIGGVHSAPNPITTSWYLTKIVHPKGDEIYFTYNSLVTTYKTSQSQNLKMAFPRTQANCTAMENSNPVLSMIYENQLKIQGKSIKTISSNKAINGTVSFDYSVGSSLDVDTGNNKITQISVKDGAGSELEKMNFTYTTTVNKRVFLDKIQYKDISKFYQFDYYDKENLPQRLSNSQDHWGYYNGKQNTNIVPKNIMDYGLSNIDYNGADKEPNPNLVMTGMLKKITYPTKGYTDLEYESNDYYGTKIIYPNKVNQSLSVVKLADDSGSTSVSFILNNKEQQDISIVGGVSFYCQDANLNVGKNRASFSVLNTTTNILEHLYSFSANGEVIDKGTSFLMTPNMTDAQKTTLFTANSGQDYLITLTAYFECTSANINFNYYPTASTVIATNIVTGGARVKQTVDNSINTSTPIIKRFFYAKKTSLAESSGNKGKTPYYIDFSQNRTLCSYTDMTTVGCETKDITYLNLSSSSIVSLFDTGNSNVFYKYVTISYGNTNFGNGGEEHEFIVNRDVPGNIIWGQKDIKSTPFTNTGWDNGLEKNIIYFNKYLIPIKETTKEYEENTIFKKEVTSYHSRKQFSMVCDGPVNYTCTADDLTKQFVVHECIANHKHFALGSVGTFFGLRYDDTCIAEGAQNVTTYFPHACYGKTLQPPTVISYLSNLENISVVAYKNISYWHYLKKTTEKQYDLNGVNPITVVTNYEYKKPNHLQLTSQSTTSSIVEPLETKYYYPPDLLASGSQTTLMQKLTDQNIIEKPIKTETFVNNVQTSENIIKYGESAATGNLLLPTEIHKMKGEGDIDVTTVSNRRIVYTLYDTDIVGGVTKGNGNILEYKLESGTPVAIIWGYNKTQPIAKIENTTYSDVASYVANLQSISDTGTEASLLTALATFRSALPNAMITTYTYKPLIGVSTVTDPKGNTTYYEYDEFNRLKLVKDYLGNILSENQYHYKN